MQGRRVVVEDAMVADWRMPSVLKAATRAFAEALFGNAESGPPAERVEFMIEELEDFLARSGFRARSTFQASMLALSTLAPVAAGKAPPLSSLSIPDRQAALEKFEQTPLGLALLAAKAMCCIHYYEHPDAAAEIGADGSCLGDGA